MELTEKIRCVVCGKAHKDGDNDFKEVENSKGEMVRVCYHCYYDNCSSCQVTGMRITPLQSRTSYEAHGEVLSRSWIDAHKEEFVPVLDSKKLYRTEATRAVKAFIIENGVYKTVPAIVSTSESVYKCRCCGDSYFAPYVDGKREYPFFLNGWFYCPKCYKKMITNKRINFYDGQKMLGLKKVEGHFIPLSSANGFEEYDWDRLNGYYDNPPFLPITRKKLLSNFKGYGFELETENTDYGDYDEDEDEDDYYGGNRCNHNEMIYSLYRAFGKTFYYKTDASLENDGAEIVSRASDWEFWKNFDFDRMCEIIKDSGRGSGRREYAGDCGMHIHASRELFGVNKEIRRKNVAKLLLFFKTFEPQIAEFANRGYNGYCGKIKLDSRNLDDAEYYVEHYGSDNRYLAINLCNLYDDEGYSKGTVEFRIFDGTTNATEIRTNIEFVHLLCTELPKLKSQKDFLDPQKIFKNASTDLQKRLKNSNILPTEEN